MIAVLLVAFIVPFTFGTKVYAKESTLLSADMKNTVLALFTGLNYDNLDYPALYGNAWYDEDEGIKAGVFGFSTKSGDLLEVIRLYESLKPDNELSKYITRLETVKDTQAVMDLGDAFIEDIGKASEDPEFIQAQDLMAQELYLSPAFQYASADGLGILGQFIYLDAIVNHGLSEDENSFDGIRIMALKAADLPLNGGSEAEYLKAFLYAQKNLELSLGKDDNALRLDTLMGFVDANNFELATPIKWGDDTGIYYITDED